MWGRADCGRTGNKLGATCTHLEVVVQKFKNDKASRITGRLELEVNFRTTSLVTLTRTWTGLNWTAEHKGKCSFSSFRHLQRFLPLLPYQIEFKWSSMAAFRSSSGHPEGLWSTLLPKKSTFGTGTSVFLSLLSLVALLSTLLCSDCDVYLLASALPRWVEIWFFFPNIIVSFFLKSKRSIILIDSSSNPRKDISRWHLWIVSD